MESSQISMLANILGSKIVEFPTTYLGMPLHHSSLRNSEWNFLTEKVEKKLAGWKGSTLSLARKLTLAYSILSATPIYWTSNILLPKDSI